MVMVEWPTCSFIAVMWGFDRGLPHPAPEVRWVDDSSAWCDLPVLDDRLRPTRIKLTTIGTDDHEVIRFQRKRTIPSRADAARTLGGEVDRGPSLLDQTSTVCLGQVYARRNTSTMNST